jgi:hypothetical protein
MGFWSGARDLNPGPHGPEIWAVSSTETCFEALSSIRVLVGRFPANFSHQPRLDYYMNYYTNASSRLGGAVDVITSR